MAKSPKLEWFHVLNVDDLPEGRVTTVTAGTHFIALVHFRGQYVAMENHCPHQGGPLGEGSIEKGVDDQCWLRCPWHGWDFDPLTGQPPGGHEDSGQEMFPVEVRDDGIYVGVPSVPKHQKTVSDVMVETMVNWGVNRVFGMVGHSNLGLADALRLQEEGGKLDFIGIRHEGAAAFACSGYGKLTGRPAACLTIAGPGATNLMTGLWDAKVDHAPVLALTGQVQEQVIGVHAFQDIDLASAFQAVSAFSQTVLHASDHVELMNQALKTAYIEQGVSHPIFPDNVQTLPVADDTDIGTAEGRLASTTISPDPADVASASEQIGKAKRPLIVVGHGAVNGMDQIVALAEQIKAPIVTTFKAKGLVSDAHPLAGGVLGRSGTPIASWFMNESDLLLVFGASFSDHTGLYASIPTVQVDLDRNRLGKRHPVTVPVWGDAGVTALQMLAQLRERIIDCTDQIPEVAERTRIWRDEKRLRLAEDRGKGIGSAALFDVLTELAPEDAIIAVDVGNNTYSFGRYFECSRQRVLMSGYLGSIGFGFPAAMGAWAATQDFPEFSGRKVISISGDGGFGQYAMEFTTAVKYGMNITHVLLNNGELGKISKEQRAGEWPVWQTSLHNPGFADFANLCGGFGQRVTDINDLRDALEKALAADGPALVEVMTDAELV
jgi:thiamine pyrophosphate-dependent acetolactate synthase large subunit-like protein/nitrite reductase/ring-hydroxylating ferredoxin subunit